MLTLISEPRLSSTISDTGEEETFHCHNICYYVFVFRESRNNLKVIIDQMRMCLDDLNDAESEIQLVNILQDMDELDVTNVTYCVLEATGAGRRVEKMKREDGNVGSLAAALVEKWKKNVRDENQRKEEAFQNKLPAELRQSEVKINTTVTAFKFGALGYETLDKVELAIIREEESNCYQLLLYRGGESAIILTSITPRFTFMVHLDYVISFTDEWKINWRICFDSQDDQTDAARHLLLCKAMFVKEEVVSTDLVIGRGREAEVGDILEIQMAVWKVENQNITSMIENTRWKKKKMTFEVGDINRFRGMTRHIVGVKKGGRIFLIVSTNNCRNAYDIEVELIRVATTATATALGRSATTAEDAADEHATAFGRSATTAEDDADEHATAAESVQRRDDAVGHGHDGTVPEPESSHIRKRRTKREKNAQIVAAKNNNVQEAVAAFKQGLFKSKRQCATAFGVSEFTVRQALKSDDYVYKGRGRKSEVMTEAEEEKIREHTIERLKLGVGLDLDQMQDLIQELLLGVVDANPERFVPWGDNGDSPYRPPVQWVRRFLKRNNLKYRSSMNINGARACVTREELELWFEDVRQILTANPELIEAMADPSRQVNWVIICTFVFFSSDQELKEC